MERGILIQLVFLCVLNVLSTVVGGILNSLVIISFWKSSQLKNKIYHFMIMLLSCFDLMAVLINHPLQTIYLAVWIREKYDMLSTIAKYFRPANILIGFSLFTLMTMSVERYLAAAYPVFHRTSVTKTKLLVLLSFFILLVIILHVTSFNDFLIPFHFHMFAFFSVVSPPLIYANYKLFKIATGIRRRRAIAPASLKSTINSKNISTCLLAVACYVIFSIPAVVYTICRFVEKESIDIRISLAWACTLGTMNSTCNCLIFFWKNNILRNEGIKVLKLLKERRKTYILS